MRSRGILASTVAFFLAGCALSQSTDKVVLDYNRDFAKSRNEMLLLNVLRAAAREPLQFSTMGQVQGSVGNGSQLTIPFTNVIAGGKDVISPSLLFTDAINPSITITPLAGKDFAASILKPMGTDTIQLFLHNGWDAQFLLPLIVGQVICPDGRVLFNSGEYLTEGGKTTPRHEAFKVFFRDFADDFTIGGMTERSFEVTEKEALEFLKGGMGPNISIADVTALPVGGKRILTIHDNSRSTVKGDVLALAALCAEASRIHREESAARALEDKPPLPEPKLSPGRARDIPGSHSIGPQQARIVFRSVGSVVQYLGETHRVRFLAGGGTDLTYSNHQGVEQILFKIDWGLSNDPKAVRTRFQETMFYIPRLELGVRETRDRTLKTLSFLDQLIALQTSENSIRGAQPVISVN